MSNRASVAKALKRHQEVGKTYFIASSTLLALTFIFATILAVMKPWDDTTLILAITALFSPLLSVLHYRYKGASAGYQNVRVSANQYPEIYQALVELCEQIGMKEIPPIYITKNPGIDPCTINPGIRGAIVLGTDFLAGCRENNTPDAVRYMIAHQLGHFQAKHNTRKWVVVSAGMMGTIGLKTLLIRNFEFTADAYAAATVPEGAGEALSLCAVGKDNYVYINVANQVQVADSQRGILQRIARWTATEIPAAERMWMLRKHGLLT